MSEKPILFNTEMVRAILDGRKTVTRRVFKLPNYVKESKENPGLYTLYAEGCAYKNQCMEDPGFQMYLRPPYQIGDILYVRESWAKDCFDHYVYKADYVGTTISPEWKWHPSIHMPKEAARVWLRVTNVRIERLQNMTDDDARQEGIDLPFPRVEDFVKLWDSTIKKQDLDKYGWEANPWVWVIEFEKCERRLNYADMQAGRTPFAPVLA